MSDSILDLDALFADELAQEVKVLRKTKLFGRDWRIIDSDNGYNKVRLSNMENDPGVITDVILGFFHPDERGDIARLLAAQPHFDIEALIKLMNALFEAVAGRPTELPSGSEGTSTTPSSEPSSADSSSSVEVAASAT